MSIIKTTFLIFLALLALQPCSAQNIRSAIDSIYYQNKALLNTDKEQAYQVADSVLQLAIKDNFTPGVILMNHQVAQYLRFTDLFDSAAHAYRANRRLIAQYLDQSEAEPYPLVCAVLGVTYYDLAIIDYMTGKYDSCIHKTAQADSVYKKYVLNTVFDQNDVKNKLAVSAMLRAAVYQRTGNLSDAIAITQDALKLYEEIGRVDNVAIAYGNLGNMYNDSGNYLASIKAYDKGIEVAAQNGFGLIEASHYMTLAEMFQSFNETDTGFEYARKSNALAERLGDSYVAANACSILGELHLQLNNMDSAIFYHRRSLDLHKDMSNPHKIGYENERLAKIYLQLEEYDSAYACINAGQEALAAVDVVIEKLLLELVKMRYFLATGRPQLALSQIPAVLDLVSRHENVRLKMEAYEVIQSVYEASQQYKLAYDYMEKYTEFRDIVFAENKGKEIAKVLYDIALEKEKEAMDLRQEQQRLVFEQENLRKQWLIYFITGALFSIVTILVVVYKSYQRKKADNVLLNEQKATIEAKNEELQALREKDQESQKVERRLLRETIFLKDRELAATAMINHEKNNILLTIGEKLDLMHGQASDNLKIDLRQLKKFVDANVTEGETWNSFIHQFEQVHPDFFHKLKDSFPEMSVNDLKLCAYIKVGMDNKQIANASNLALSTVKKNINRVKKKIALTPEESIRDFLLAYSGSIEAQWSEQAHNPALADEQMRDG